MAGKVTSWTVSQGVFGRGFEYKADEEKSGVSVRWLMQQHLRGLNQASSHDKMELSLKHTF